MTAAVWMFVQIQSRITRIDDIMIWRWLVCCMLDVIALKVQVCAFPTWPPFCGAGAGAVRTRLARRRQEKNS